MTASESERALTGPGRAGAQVLHTLGQSAYVLQQLRFEARDVVTLVNGGLGNLQAGRSAWCTARLLY